MATVLKDSSGIFRIRFRVAGVHAYRSLQTTEAREADAAKLRVEETLKELKLGKRAIPDTVDPVTWVLGGGRIEKSSLSTSLTLAQAVEKYLQSIPIGAKEHNTLVTINVHLRHLQRLLGAKKPIRTLKTSDLQSYAATRSREPGANGRLLSADTLRKELVTFGQLWKWALSDGLVSHPIDTSSVVLPKKRAKPRFHTREEIESQITTLTSEPDKKDLWDSLFLRASEILELLEHVEKTALHDWIYPAIAFAALTGARRSEILRAELSDFSLDNPRKIRVREKKRVKGTDFSYRYVDMNPRLTEILRGWMQKHPGGTKLFVESDGTPLSVDQANHHFQQTMLGSKWEVLKGWHVLRHSFASICASRGVKQQTIAAWMGHETAEMQARYQHLFPEDTADDMSRMFT